MSDLVQLSQISVYRQSYDQNLDAEPRQRISESISKFDIPEQKFESIRVKLNPHKPSKQIRGHFLFAAALCFINYEVNRLKAVSKKTHMSNDDLYTILILTCKSLLSDLPELTLLKNKATVAGEKVVKLLSQ